MQSFKKVKELYNTKIDKLKDVGVDDKRSGIYLIYIKDIESKDYIPIYIGQSVNIYNRRTAHRMQIKKLFLEKKELYNMMISLNAGKYLYCKIVSTLRNNNKTMEDVKFKIIEYCDKDLLDSREQYWIKFYESTIYGFNQVQEIVDSNKVIAMIRKGNDNNKNWNEIAIEGKNTLIKMENKLHKFNEDLKKYKYYQVNYTLLFGNFWELNECMNSISKHSMEIDNEIDDELSRFLEELDTRIKLILVLLVKKGYILEKNELYKRLAIE